MANDIDMWNDLEDMPQMTREHWLLFRCYNARYIEGDIDNAEKYKEEYIEEFGNWGNYY